MLSSFLSRLRFPSSNNTNPQDDGDDTSSLGRSLNLPWPVTESSAGRRVRPTTPTPTPRRDWASNSIQLSQTSGSSGVSISYPILRTTPNSFTGFVDDFPMPPTGLPRNVNVNLIPRTTTGVSAQAQAPAPYPPPEVVRLVDDETEDDLERGNERSSPPKYQYEYTSHPSASSYALPYPYPSASVTANASTSDHMRGLGQQAASVHSNSKAFSRGQDHEDEDEAELYTSPFDDPLESVPAATSSWGLASSSPSASNSNANANSGAGPMTKARWNLKLQLNGHDTGSRSVPSSQVGAIAGTGASFAPQHPNDDGNLLAGEDDPFQRPSNIPGKRLVVLNFPTSMSSDAPSKSSNAYRGKAMSGGIGVETDVFNGAYDHPLVKQLSPIVEMSPGPETDSRDVSLRFGRSGGLGGGRPSPGAESWVGSLFGGGVAMSTSASASVSGKEKERDTNTDTADKESMRTRTGSVRTGSVGSVGTVNGRSRSRAGSVTTPIGATPLSGQQNASPASEIARPSPVYPSPFLTRHLNRTVSQTSSKSDSHTHSPAAHAPQPQLQTQTQAQTQAPLQGVTAAVGSTSRPNTGQSTATPNQSSAGGREVPQSPISPATATPTAATSPTGTMYTPTSTLLQTPIAQTPISPGAVGVAGAVVTPHPPTVETTSPSPTAETQTSGSSSALHKIPSLPAMSPIDLRFSVMGSVAPRTSVSRETRANRHSKGASTIRPGLGQGMVDRLPVIEGSVDGYYEEEVEMEGSDEEGGYDEDEEDEEEWEEEEYDRESLHAESFVTAGTNEDAAGGDKHRQQQVGGNDDQDHDPELAAGGLELATLNKETHSGASTPRIPSASASASGSNSGSIRSLPRALVRPDSRGLQTPGTPGSANSATGESFIHRRWDRAAAESLGRMTSSPTTMRAKRQGPWPFRLFSTSSSATSSTTFTPAFWAFWLGFLFPVLWLIGGWHFTNAGELPPKVTVWEWYFWNSHWSMEGFRYLIARLFACCRARKLKLKHRRKEDTIESGHSASGGAEHVQRRRGKRRSYPPGSKARIGKVYPSLPRWVAERQTTDDGRIRLNDPKRSMRGISFGYPFISRPGVGSQDSAGGAHNPSQWANPSPSSSSKVMKKILVVLDKPNRLLDLMYGVKLTEVRGRPETGRRMFDPWIQRCRYAFCYGLAVVAVGLCIASVWLVVVNTKKL